MKNLHVLFTMDCEAIDAYATEGGPPDWDFAKRSIDGFCERLHRHGFCATLFTVARTAKACADVIHSCVQAGAEAALHLHPQDDGYTDYLGAYTACVQKQMIKEAMDRWSAALNMRPFSFRGGNLSANDATFSVLAELGFEQSSLSVPDRNFTRVKSNWKGSSYYPYYTNRANRLIEGDMNFLEAPVTCDWESIMWGGLTPLELRIEMVDARAHGYTVRKNVERQLTEQRIEPALVVLTHNIFDYADKNEFRTRVLEGLIDEMKRCADLHQMNLCGPTLSEYKRTFDNASKPNQKE